MWTEILCTNAEAVRNSAQAMIEKLHELITLLDSPDPEQAMHEFLTQAKAQRDRLRLPR
jgi:prephenate dehydrogenase